MRRHHLEELRSTTVVLDALIGVLIDKEIIHKGEIQLKILTNSTGEEDES